MRPKRLRNKAWLAEFLCLLLGSTGCVVYRTTPVNPAGLAAVPLNSDLELRFAAPRSIPAVSRSGASKPVDGVIALQGRLDSWGADSLTLSPATARHAGGHLSGPYRQALADTSCVILQRRVDQARTALGNVALGSAVALVVGFFSMVSQLDWVAKRQVFVL